MSIKLYEIKNEYLEALDHLNCLNNISNEIVSDSLAAINQSLEEKVKNIAGYIKNLEAEAIAMKQYEDNMNKKRKAIENKIQSIKNYIKENMIACGITKIDSPELNILIKRCKSSPLIIDESKIPKEFYKIKTEEVLDKNKLMDVLEYEKIDGVEIQENYSLTIK